MKHHCLKKEEFCCNLNIEHIADAVYMNAKILSKDFEMKDLGEYYDSHLKIDALLLADIFENLKKKMFKIYHLDPA